MKYVIDSSVAFKWAVLEPLSDKASLLRDDFRNGIHDLLAPDLFPVEVANALLVAERRGRILAGQAAIFFADILSTLPTIHTSLPDLLPRAFAIAAQTGTSAYDSVYVALAQREQCQLVSADDKLVNGSQPLFPFVRHLSTLP